MRAVVLVPLPDPPPDAPPPGRQREVDLPDAVLLEDGLSLPGLVVRDVRGVEWSSRGAAGPPPVRGGAALPGRDGARNRAFGVANTAWHLARGLDAIRGLLGRPLPPLVVRVGTHADEHPGWGGAHYRVPARRYSRLQEPADWSSITGEIHLGCGRDRLLATPDGPLRDAPSHNPGIIAHELGHHLLRHTADVRANALARPDGQSNRKVALDEGFADYTAAMLLGHADIFGWHRSWRAGRHSRTRRDLDGGWTMGAYRGGRRSDPHRDGMVVAGALWAARAACVDRHGVAEPFDGLVVHALVEVGRTTAPWGLYDGGIGVDGGAGPRTLRRALRRRRRRFSILLATLLQEDMRRGSGLGDLVQRAFADRGVVLDGEGTPGNQALARRCGLPVQLPPSGRPVPVGPAAVVG